MLASAASFYQQALDLDPSFALATARLVRSRLSSHRMVTPLSPAELDEVKTMVDRTLSAAPDLSASHFNLGIFHYLARLDYEPALAAFSARSNFSRTTRRRAYIADTSFAGGAIGGAP